MQLLLTVILLLPPQSSVTKPNTQASFRAIGSSDSGVLCIAGNGPEVWISKDRGQSWSNRTPTEEKVTDYRCVAFPEPNDSDGSMVIASAGSPAVILRSPDLGRSWKRVYFNPHQAAFIDGLKFWDADRGIAFGDPVDGAFLLLKTVDGGETWNELACEIDPLPGEAGFAASNSSMVLQAPSTVLIGLGGREDGGPSRVLRSEDAGNSWTVHELASMPAGPSSGVFSISLRNDGTGYAVGGNYKEPKNRIGTVAFTSDGGRSWRPAESTPLGYRSCILYVNSNSPKEKDGRWIATGPSGTDVLRGTKWIPLVETGFHTLHRLSSGSVLASGASGSVAVIDSDLVGQ